MFVYQQLAASRLHYDLRLECDGVLMSWAVPKGPSLDPAEKRLAVRTENHPFDYGSFEGVIPPGQYGAGEVIVWDCGVYSPDEDQEHWFHDREEAERRVREGMEKGKLGILLRGEKVKGSFALVRTKDAKNWLLIKHKDRFAAKVDLTAQNRSVLSGVTVEELTSVPVQRLPAALLTASGVKLRSRRGLELGGDFPRLADELLLPARLPSQPRAAPRRLPRVQLVHAVEDGVALHEAAMATGLEGVVGKRKDSTYEAGKRSTAWLKVKATNSADFVIGGGTEGEGGGGARAARGPAGGGGEKAGAR